MSGLIRRLESALSGSAESLVSSKDRRYRILVKPENLLVAAESLVEEFNPRLMTASCIDEGLDFNVLYHFDVGGEVVTLGTSVPKENPNLPSMVAIVPEAQWIEREIADLFGIKFAGHPQPGSLIAAPDWAEEKPPLRKPLEGAVPPEHRGTVENVISIGAVLPLASRVGEKREEAGLPKPTIAFEDEAALEEVHGIVKRSKADERAGFDWEKKKLRYR